MNGVTKKIMVAIAAVVGLGLAVVIGTPLWFGSPDPASGGAPAPAGLVSRQEAESEPGSSDPASPSVSAAAASEPSPDGDAGFAPDIGELAATALHEEASPEERKAAVSALAESGGVEAVDALFSVASSVFASDQGSTLSHHLAQSIVALSTPEAVERMGLILTDDNPGYPAFADLPAALQDAIQSALRKNPDAESVAEFLVGQHSSDIGELAKSRIQMLEHPETTARLAQLAFQQENNPLFQERMAMLETTRDSRVYDSAVRLARENVVGRLEVQSLIYNWASNNSQLMDPDLVFDQLRAANLPPPERSLAAFALAGYGMSSTAAQSSVLVAYDELLSRPDLDRGLREEVLRAKQMLVSP